MSTEASSGAPIVLPEVFDLSNVTTMKMTLLDHFEKGHAVTFDCSNVVRITTPAVQLLLAYAKSLGEEGLVPKFRKPSAAFASAFGELGLQHQLSQWSIT